MENCANCIGKTMKTIAPQCLRSVETQMRPSAMPRLSWAATDLSQRPIQVRHPFGECHMTFEATSCLQSGIGRHTCGTRPRRCGSAPAGRASAAVEVRSRHTPGSFGIAASFSIAATASSTSPSARRSSNASTRMEVAAAGKQPSPEAARSAVNDHTIRWQDQRRVLVVGGRVGVEITPVECVLNDAVQRFRRIGPGLCRHGSSAC